MKTLLTFAALSISLFAAPPQTELTPVGIWPLCLGGINLPACAGVTASSAAYEVLIRTNNPEVVGYRYTFTLILQNGSTLVLHKYIERTDNALGVTEVFFMPGDVIATPQIDVQALLVEH
jgi:hypothetical protein